MVNTALQLGSLTFKNRVLVASGTFGYGDETAGLVDLSKIGGLITKSLSLKPREGNAPRRIAETASGMLNSIGLANIGVHRFISEKLPFLRGVDTAVIANIAASSVEEYCSVLSLLEREEGVDAFEINVSCPNVREGGLTFGTSCPAVAEITRRLRALTSKPLIIKLTPNVTHISEFARAAENEGADALSVINTLIGMAVDIHSRRPLLSTVTRRPFGAGDQAHRPCEGVRGGKSRPDSGDRDRRNSDSDRCSGVSDHRGLVGAGGDAKFCRT